MMLPPIPLGLEQNHASPTLPADADVTTPRLFVVLPEQFQASGRLRNGFLAWVEGVCTTSIALMIPGSSEAVLHEPQVFDGV
jgi:hypothetical protein